MEKRFQLADHGRQLWTRERAREVRSALMEDVEQLEPGDSVVIDAEGVEVFDYSFANELFGKTLLALPREYPGRFMMVENLSRYTRENLEKALEGMGLTMIERTGKGVRLLGKVHPADEKTFGAIARKTEPVTAAQLSAQLDVTLNAINERLSKLVSLGLVRRERGASSAGREQYEYTLPR